MKDCTCTGTCRGNEGLGPGWRCVLEELPRSSEGEPLPCDHRDQREQWAAVRRTEPKSIVAEKYRIPAEMLAMKNKTSHPILIDPVG